MKYKKFFIENYRAIKNEIAIDISSKIVALVGVNGCGKTTILQAIFCFDNNNDKINAGKQLENIQNLYSTVQGGDSIISAEIECTAEEILECIDENLEEVEEEDVSSENLEFEENIKEAINKKGTIIIHRNLSRNAGYSCAILEEFFEEDVNDSICKVIVNKLPYILYNDDFNDRPVSEINLDDESGSNVWCGIFERVFSGANREYSLRKIFSEDDRIVESIVSDVESYLGITLTDAWAKFAPAKKKISISLKPKPENKTLKIQIKETLENGCMRYFEITDMSKGFIWYYNFIMKIRFNPKQRSEGIETIFLLDEPGSYLHATAQEDLCKKIGEIYENEGAVIYCTHSPNLLLPDVIPYSQIKIVDKIEKDGIVSITAESILTKNTVNSVEDPSMQPLYEALQKP